MRNRRLAWSAAVLAVAGASAMAPVAALTPAALSADPPVHFVQSPSAIPGQKCTPTTRLLVSSKPAPKALPGGLTMRIWDTGPVKNPRLALKGLRIVAVRVPARAAAGATIISAPNLSSAQTPYTQIQHRPNVITAVNGAIFNLRTLSTPDGPQVINGVVQKGTYSPSDTLNFDQNGRISAGLFQLTAHGTIWVPNLGQATPQSLPIRSLNNQVLTSGLNVYTNVWGPQVHPFGLRELWLKGTVQQSGTTTTFVGAVSEVRTKNLGQQPPPVDNSGQSTWVLTSTADNDGLFTGFGVGMSVRITLGYQTMDRSHNITTNVVAAMERGGVYVAGGKNRANCSFGNEDLRPRTLIGWNTTTGDMFFVTIQGKYDQWGVRWGGATVHQAADYLISLGADTAVALDGGGSTTMLVRTKLGGTPIHIDRSNPRDTQRPVVNVIGIVPIKQVTPSPSPSVTPSATPTPSASPTTPTPSASASPKV